VLTTAVPHALARAGAISLALGATNLPALAAMQTVTLDVPGMNCPTCPITVKKALTKVNGVTQVKVSFKPPHAMVTFDDTKSTVDALTLATQQAGFPSTVLTSKP